ncbi:DNA-binding protein [Enterococcus lemanii]|uniref:DNA-binding protein n=1 Tax=Enterococcus lemanii TaxID=1159752 RepID=A0ABV9MQR2_9ENTE|nr:DNA-binding protein [Enterococcus lemanii]MBM7710231.1 hypothetical protein [Enterococcus lemanii]
MSIEIPFEHDEVLVNVITQNVIKVLQGSPQQNTNNPLKDLPPYPNRKQVKQVLRIGDERLNHWISSGLKVIPFGKEMRFDRRDIQAFLDQLKI